MSEEASRVERPVVEALDSILGVPFKVLDDGFVRVIDYMGADESIVQAARVSYGRGTKKVHEDRGLIRYLMRHWHTTPFEMCDIKLHVRVPMDCWRQWIRHRTACLAEGTEIHFDLPGGMQRRGDRLCKVKIEDLWQQWQPACNRTRREGQKDSHSQRDGIRGMHLRQMKEDTLRLGHTRVVDIYKNGRKPVFAMILADGKRIEATKDHRFFFSTGWATLEQGAGLCEREGRAVWNAGEHHVYVNGAELAIPAGHQDRDWLNEQSNVRNLKIEETAGSELAFVELLGGEPVRAPWPKKPVHQQKVTVAKLVRIERFEYVGEKETYDLEVEGPFHNFIANGIVTHNSVNEYSTRYSIAIDAAQRAGENEWRAQSAGNRQGSEGYLDSEQGRALSEREQQLHALSREIYQERLQLGVAREQARKDLPLSTYTEAYWKTNLHNLFHFLRLRMDAHAQEEIRDYARVIGEQIVARWVPIAWEAFLDYQFHATGLTRLEMAVVRAVASGDNDAAMRAAASYGWLEQGAKGLKVNRERGECEAKLRELGLPIPWAQ
ncbi:MAG TPA: FAD-dependent thymidylate synthase [Candidatus Limnocylindrales bacterium]|nr:FAD-dependent thymidylate synthase [Candidatus Limnocylindrales bacterium]